MLKQKTIRLILLLSFFAGCMFPAFSQFAPPPGNPGTTAIYKDSSVFTVWAASCEVTRGWVKISDTNFYYWVNPDLGSNKAFFGDPPDATGKADDTLVVSLGDGGVATLTFNGVIRNGPGYDFAVFENGLNDAFLELAFVEVSSDGVNFFRFPCTSLTNPDVQVPTFGTIDATKIDNLAGKYRFGYGTPFDLDTLKAVAGLDVEKITHVRIIDVVGCIQPQYATYDALGNPVNDLWPTPFNTCGFDLDAVGVIHLDAQGIDDNEDVKVISVSPNPFTRNVRIRSERKDLFTVKVYDLSGKIVKHFINFRPGSAADLSELNSGLYLLTATYPDGTSITTKISKW